MLTTLQRYTLLAWLLLPLAFLRLLWRSRRLPAYRQHWGERLGRYARQAHRPVIWLHAVSVGEARAAGLLIQHIRQQYPGHQVVLTHMTPTGRQTAPELIGNDVIRCYLPFDLPFAVQRFLDHFNPRLGLLLETEIWPHLILACDQRHIPLLLVNARLSEKSFRRYQRHQPLAGNILGRLPLIAPQTDQDAQRFAALGARHLQVAGNLKFDAPASPSAALVHHLHSLLEQHPRRWLAASTRPGEEALLLDLLPRLDLPDTLLMLVPRHPQRFREVAAMLAHRGIPFARRSDNQPVPPGVKVWLGDSMGELSAYYTLADVAVIGGSLLPFGGQNLMEATAVGCPVILGPHTFNFSEASQDAISAGAALRVQEASDLLQVLPPLFQDASRRQHMQAAGLAFTQQHQGATRRIMQLVETFLPSP